MVMDEAAIQRVVRFSIHLRNSADILLGYPGVVSVDTWTLYEIEEAFSLILEAEQLTDFHVLPPNHRQHPSIPHIQFLYDILQKIKKLKILANLSHILPNEQQINLKCFRNLSSLELNCVPIKQLKGLQNLRPVLKSLTCQKSCSSLEDILGKCGADKSTDYVWENLKIGIFSHNCIKFLDNSLSLMISIRVLDLSYCELIDVTALACLPIIYKLDLSYNKISSVPLLSDSAANSLIALDLGNNMILDLIGIDRFPNLQELDVKQNFISLEVTLIHLLSLPQLKYLNMMRNPITFSINYRVRTLKCLHVQTKLNEELILDDRPVDYNERKFIGAKFETTEPINVGIRLLKYLTDKMTDYLKVPKKQEIINTPDCSNDSSLQITLNLNLCPTVNDEVTVVHTPNILKVEKSESPKEHSRKKSRKKRTRNVLINDPDDEISPIKSLNINVSPPQYTGDAKGQEESGAMYHYVEKADDSLLETEYIEASNMRGPLQSDKLLDEILHSHVGIIDVETFDVQKPLTKMTSESASMLDRKRDIYSSISSSQDLSPIPSDDEDEEENREVNSIMARWDNNEADSEYAVVSFSDCFYKEKNALTYSTIIKMCISSLMNMEVLSIKPIKVKLFFNNINPELSSRIFILESDQYEKLKQLIEPIIRKNSLHRDDTKPLCKKCGLSFRGLKAQPSGTMSEDCCRYCGNNIRAKISNRLIENEASIYVTPPCDMPNFNKNVLYDAKIYEKTKTQCDKNNTTNQSSDSSESFSVCSSEVSSVRRASDVDIISNPSMSSIEVLAEQSQDAEIDTQLYTYMSPKEYNKTSTELTLQDAKPDNKNIQNSKHEPMQDSSSSGSMTGSVCTAVDRLSSGPNTPLKRLDELKQTPTEDTLKQGSCEETLSTSAKSTDTVCHRPSLKEALAQLSDFDAARKGIIFKETDENELELEPYLYSLLHGYTGYNWLWWKEISLDIAKTSLYISSNPVSYCYEDFAQVDHRLELYVELFLFKEDNERLQGLAKAIIVMEDGHPFLGLVVISDFKLYVLKITESEDDSPQNWLDEYDSLWLNDIVGVYNVINGQGLVIKSYHKDIFICLADPDRSNAMCNFLTGVLKMHFVTYEFGDTSSRLEEDFMAEINALDYIAEENEIKCFQIVSLMHKNGTTRHCFFVITATYLFLFEADLNWFFHKRTSDAHLKLILDYRIDDITKMNVLTDSIMRIDFYSEASDEEGISKEPWLLHVPSSGVGCHVINTIRNLWISCYKVEFDIICNSTELQIVKDILKDSIFRDYFKQAS